MIKKLIDICLQFWDKILLSGFNFKFCRVDREKFIRKLLKNRVDQTTIDRAVESFPVNVVNSVLLKKLINRKITLTALVVASISFICAVPQSGFLMWAGCVVDFAQFQIFVFIIIQKLLFTYLDKDVSGREAIDLSSNATKGYRRVFRLAVSASGMILTSAIKQIFRRVVVRMLILNFVKQIALKYEFAYSKNVIESGIDIFAVFSTCLITALVSYILFAPMMRRQQRKMIIRTHSCVPIKN